MLYFIQQKFLFLAICYVFLLSLTGPIPCFGFGAPSNLKPGMSISPGPVLPGSHQTFSWSQTSGAGSYLLNLRDVTGSTLVNYPIFGGGITNTEIDLIQGHAYKWNMFAYTGSNTNGTESPVSISNYFQIGRPDLLVTGSPYPSTTVPTAGNPISIFYTVSNQGDGDSIACSNRIQIKPHGSVNTLVEDWFVIGAIPSGSSANLNAQLTIPTSASEGYYDLYIIVDSKSANNQSNTGNDVISSSYFLYVYPRIQNLTPYRPAGWADKLVVGNQPNQTNADSALTSADIIYATWAGINAGTASIAQQFYVSVLVDDSVRYVWRTTTSINTNTPFSGTGPIATNLTAGSHSIRLKLDSGLEVTESNETDNEFVKNVTVTDSLSISVNTPDGGNPLSACNSNSVTWTISGNTSQVAGFKFGYSLDGGTTFTDLSDSIASSATSFSWTPHALRSTQARVRIRAYDSSNQLLSEGTNPNNFTITIPSGKPTAVPGTFNVSPAPGVAVQFVDLSSPSSACSKIASRSWNFDDGTTSSLAAPMHKFYPAIGSHTYNVTLSVTDANGETDQYYVPIYVSGQSLGTLPTANFSRDPVNLATGNYVYQHTDLRIPGRGFPFEFARFYNSKSADQNGLGFGWTHSYNIHLSTTTSNATVTFGDGHSETHILSGGQYTAEAGVYNVLTNTGSAFILVSKDQTRRNFDGQGRLTSVADKNGNTLSLAYDNGILTNITDTVGRHIVFQSDNNGLLRQVIDPIGRSIQFAYDSQTNLFTVIDSNLGTNSFLYDTNHQLTDAFDARGVHFVHNAYDSLQRVVSYQTDAHTNQSGFFYDFPNRVTYVTNAFGKFSVHRQDDRLLETNVVDEAGNQEVFGYDADHNRVLIQDKNGNQTRYGYDSHGNVTNKTDALNNVTSIEYDSLNNPTRRIDALTNITSFGYDSRGNLTSTTNALGFVSRVEYSADGLPIVLTDARGFSTTNNFDSEGNLAAVIDAGGFTNRFEYDPAGRKIRQIDALNHATSFVYDNNDNLLSTTNSLGFVNTFTYDGNNNRITYQNPRTATVTNVFDLKDRLIATLAPLNQTNGANYDALDRKIGTFDALGNPTRYCFDDIGNLIAVTNALVQTTRFTYDAQGNQTSIIDPTGHYVTNLFDALNRRVATIDTSISTNLTAYDALGRVTATTNANGQVTQFFYDAIGRLTNVVDAANQSLFFAYDENGNRIRTKDPNGHSWTNVFDELNRLFEQDDPLGNKTVFHYDPVGNLTNKITANGTNIFYAYDALNRLTNITYPSGPPVAFFYDEVGNRTNMVDTVGTTTWHYDLLDRLTSITDPFGQTVSNGFDANGNRVSLIYPGDKIVSYGFDALNRMTTLTNWLNGVVTYDYDSRGNLVASTNANGATVSYSYDVADRLIALTNVAPDTNVIAAYAVTLDGIGNHTQASHDQPLLPVLPYETNNYSYDADNRLLSMDGQAVTHNNNGDLTSTGTSTYTYDFEGRLVSLANGSTNTAFIYDGLGNRLARTVDERARRFVLDRSGALTQVLVETDTNNSPIAYYVYGLGLAQRISASGTVATYHFNMQGSTVALTDSAGNITDSYAYDSFGVLANSEGNSPQPFRYLGRYGILDDSTGLLYARARYFSPQLGRFLTKDPITGMDGDSQSLNRYVYALNSPCRLIDVSGLSPSEWQVANSTLPYFVLSSDKDHESLIQWHPFEGAFGFSMYLSEKFDVPLRLATHVDTKFGGLRIGEYRITPGTSINLNSVAKTLKVLDKVDKGMLLYSVYSNSSEELQSRGITGSSLINAWSNAGQNIAYGVSHPDDLIQALNEGLTSASAMSIRFLTFGLVEIHGNDIQSFVNEHLNLAR